MTVPGRVVESERSRAIRRIDEWLAITKLCAVLLLILLLPFVGTMCLPANGAGLISVLVLLPAMSLFLADLLLFHLHWRQVLAGALLLQPLLCLLAGLAFCIMMTGKAPSDLPANLFASGSGRAVLLLACAGSFVLVFIGISLVSRIPRNLKLFLSMNMLFVTIACLAASYLRVAGH